MKRKAFMASLFGALGALPLMGQYRPVFGGKITPGALPEQVHKFGPRLHRLIYELPARRSSPWNVLSRVARMFLGAKSVTLRYDSIVTTGIDEWGVATLRDLLDSYEDGEK